MDISIISMITSLCIFLVMLLSKWLMPDHVFKNIYELIYVEIGFMAFLIIVSTVSFVVSTIRRYRKENKKEKKPEFHFDVQEEVRRAQERELNIALGIIDPDTPIYTDWYTKKKKKPRKKKKYNWFGEYASEKIFIIVAGLISGIILAIAVCANAAYKEGRL